jgi:alpha-tubulin suppressor-like RCC1 family protein
MLPFLRLPFLAFLAGLFLVLSQGRVAAQTLPGTAASGDHHSLCIHADGTLWATGDNFFGQLGTGNTTSTATWVQVGTATDWVQVSAGGIYSLGLKANGTVYAWGTNAHGQLGINSTAAYVPTPTAVAGGPYTQVMAGETHALALRADGKAYAWGDNSNGELGNPTNAGTTTPNPSPLPVSGGPYSQLAPSFFYTLALTPSGALYAWGSNQYGQFGNGTTGPARASNPVPARVGTAVYTQVAAGPVYCMALRADGTLWWGTNAGGQLGIATNNGTYITVKTPTLVDGGIYTQVAAGGAVTLALKPNGTLWAWGGGKPGVAAAVAAAR